MSYTLRMEAERIRTLRPFWYLVSAALLIGVLASSFVATNPARGPLTADKTMAVLTGGSSAAVLPFVGLPLLFAGAIAVLEDTRHKLATVVLVAQPRRSTLMLARLLVLAAVALPVGVAQMLASSISAVAFGRTPDFSLVLETAAPHLAALIVFTWVGAALGWLTGSAGATVGVVLLDMLLLEPLVKIAGIEYSDWLENNAERMPFGAARDSLALDPSAMLHAATYATVLLAGAWLLVRTRDY
ncbi:hypothetical protein [Kineosporia babensis]|uniref:Uncharacterized protein n=1 Tax=Kineosporia babensis TaxID=499548 RepID=A0A9X1SU00_9ACTN|nr:hypothetical protein [Kineosporia babensis]MCD5312387.1 hypothetical protein [Kineosporia babensis]